MQEKADCCGTFSGGYSERGTIHPALELVDHLLLNDPENPLLDLCVPK